MPMIKQFGLHWARNQENLEEIEDLAGHKSGIYVLYHGAMPVYIGRGAISARLLSHGKEGSKKDQFWDRFSWFVIARKELERELEALLLEALPFYVRSLNKQSGRLAKKLQVPAPNKEVSAVALPRLAPQRRKRQQTL
jgi:hypothetical protein